MKNIRETFKKKYHKLTKETINAVGFIIHDTLWELSVKIENLNNIATKATKKVTGLLTKLKES